MTKMQDLIDAAQSVIDNWETGDLASAVNMLEGAVEEARAVPNPISEDLFHLAVGVMVGYFEKNGVTDRVVYHDTIRIRIDQSAGGEDTTTEVFDQYPKPWQIERVEDNDGSFSYEIRDAGFMLMCAVSEDDFLNDDSEPDDKSHSGDALAVARIIVEAVNKS